MLGRALNDNQPHLSILEAYDHEISPQSLALWSDPGCITVGVELSGSLVTDGQFDVGPLSPGAK